MESAIDCPKCKAKMDLGFVVDYAGSGAALKSNWVEGEPKIGFWTGMKIDKPHPITTYRCTNCGYLESYA